MNIKNKIQGKTPYVYAKMKKYSAYTIYGDICKSVFFQTNNYNMKPFSFIALICFPIYVIASNTDICINDTIYKPGNIYIFEATVDSISKGTQHSCYIVMRVLNKEMYNQRVITYDYYDSLPNNFIALDSISSIDKDSFIESTEIFENSKLLWIHPPRTHGFSITQYYPFPEIHFPVKIGRKYRRSFLSFNDPLFNCTLLLRYKMCYLSFSQWKYQNKLVEICEQSGFAKSPKGLFTVIYRYNDDLGLVEAIYKYNQEIQIQISLINVIYDSYNCRKR